MSVTGYCEPLVSQQTVQHGEERGGRYMCNWNSMVIRRGRVRGRSATWGKEREECDRGGRRG